jgi:ketosteroid isomerase-like protein
MSDEQEILALEATWRVAPLAGDLETVSRVTADDWVGVGPAGQVMRKAGLLEMLSRPAPFVSATYDDVQLYVYGQTAVVTSRFCGERRDDQGPDNIFVQRFMRVYAKRDGQWQCVATQVVPVPEQKGIP